jgi:hypothetical protein
MVRPKLAHVGNIPPLSSFRSVSVFRQLFGLLGWGFERSRSPEILDLRRSSKTYHVLELKAVYLALLLSYYCKIKGDFALCYNTTAVAFLQKHAYGWSHSGELCQFAWEILLFFRSVYFPISSSHSFRRNVWADDLSRKKPLLTEWKFFDDFRGYVSCSIWP